MSAVQALLIIAAVSPGTPSLWFGGGNPPVEMNVPPDQQLATVATKDEQRREEVVYASSLGDATRGSGDARIAETEQVDDGTNKKKTWKKPVVGDVGLSPFVAKYSF